MSEHEIEKLHRQIIKDYIMDFHAIYTQPISSSTKEVDPYKICLDQYFTGVTDDIWLKLEQRPKINKEVQKKLSEFMIDLVLSTPRHNIYTIKQGDKICKDLKVDIRIGTSHFIIVKYNTKEITPSVRGKIINTLSMVKNKYYSCQLSVGIIEDSYNSIYFDADKHIYQLSGDALLNLTIPYENPTNKINALLIDELSYCFDQKINSPLQTKSILRLSKHGIHDAQILTTKMATIINDYEVRPKSESKPKSKSKPKPKPKPKPKSESESELESESEDVIILPPRYKKNTVNQLKPKSKPKIKPKMKSNMKSNNKKTTKSRPN